MSLADEAAQVVFVAFHGESPNSRSKEYRKFVHLIREVRIGGLVLNNAANGRTIPKAEPYKVAAFLNRLQRMARVPLMVGGDLERGASMRLEDTTVFPHAMAFGAANDLSLTRYEGEDTAREARAIGIHWIFYPVADVNNNPNNPIINIRSFGESPEAVARHVAAWIEGAHSDPKNYVLATAKHFPGHGDTAVDSHMNLPSIAADRERLERVELAPFRAAIAAGADAIMTGHIAVPAVDPSGLPATLSPEILSGLLRRDLGFQGLVVTDALEMGGIAKSFSSGEAAVRALEAGADALLMPADPEAAVRAIVAAVQSGRLSRARLETSVIRILAAKEKVGLSRQRYVRLEALSDVLNAPEANQKAQEVADRAVTLVRNAGNLLPLAAPEKTCYVVMPESRSSSEGQALMDELRRRAPSAPLVTLDPGMPLQQVNSLLGSLGGCPNYAVLAFASVSAYRGSVGLAGELPQALERMHATGKPIALVALGDPYLLESYPWVAAYLATFSTVPPSARAALKALWGEIEISGHLPVSIPGQAALGAGISARAIRIPISPMNESLRVIY